MDNGILIVVVGVTDKEVAVPSFRRRASAIDADHDEEPTKKPVDTSAATKALGLADEAEAEAAEAEAIAAAASARARAIRLRREAQAAESRATNGAAAVVEAEPADVRCRRRGRRPDAEDETVAAEKSDVVIDESEEQPEEEAAPSRRRRGRILKIVAMALAILCTGALLAASGFMVLQHRKAVDTERA